jgi:hypothetical protein
MRRSLRLRRGSLVLPTGDENKGLGDDTLGYWINLPLSKIVHDRLTLHANAGLTVFPDLNGRNPVSYNLGGSVIYAASRNFNLMLETVGFWGETVNVSGGIDREFSALISPGARYAFNFVNESQLVVGLAAPIGLTGSAPDFGVLFYLSFETFPKARRAPYSSLINDMKNECENPSASLAKQCRLGLPVSQRAPVLAGRRGLALGQTRQHVAVALWNCFAGVRAPPASAHIVRRKKPVAENYRRVSFILNQSRAWIKSIPKLSLIILKTIDAQPAVFCEGRAIIAKATINGRKGIKPMPRRQAAAQVFNSARGSRWCATI